jgi:isopenicillin-N epimerase
MHAAIVSWGWGEGRPEFGTTQFQRRNAWQGTRDPASYLTVPAAISYQAERDWPVVRDRCHELVLEGRRRIAELSGLPQVCPESRDWFVQMATCPIRTDSAARLKTALYEHRYRIEIPVMEHKDQQYVRISIQGYNTLDDVDRLLTALEEVM